MSYKLAKVKRGIALLSSIRPGWENQVDLDSLILSSCTRCVLGQLYGNYYDGVPEVVPEYASMLEYDQNLAASKLGFFLCDSDNTSRNYRALTETWKDQIVLLRLDNLEKDGE